MDKQRLHELAGISENVQSDFTSGDVPRLEYLITYYIDGFGTVNEQMNNETEEVMEAVSCLQGRDLYNLSPTETKMAQAILTYGSDV